MNTNNPIPITVLSGFLGSGKTTLLNKIINTNKGRKFALIINEFGEVGIDGKIIENYNEEIVEISDGCVCCVVQSDLLATINKVLERGNIDYILLEASGLAEPEPLLNTLVMMNSPKVKFDSMVTVVDIDNYENFCGEYKVVADQVKLADIVVINKVTDSNESKVADLTSKVKEINPYCSVIINTPDTPINIFVETGEWNLDRLTNLSTTSDHTEKHEHSHDNTHKDEDHNHSNEHSHLETEKNHSHSHEHNHEHHSGHHHHDHDDVDEVVFTTDKAINPNKMDAWLYNNFPANAIRSKGILRLKTPKGIENFVFQMVGANKSLVPMSEMTSTIPAQSVMVFIGKNLDKKLILESLESVGE
jgi:G3E family GTPase